MVPGYIIVWHPPASCGRCICTEFNPSTGQGDIPISSTGCACFLIYGSVEGQYITSRVVGIPLHTYILLHDGKSNLVGWAFWENQSSIYYCRCCFFGGSWFFGFFMFCFFGFFCFFFGGGVLICYHLRGYIE